MAPDGMRLVQVAQRAEDLGRATAFYVDLLGAQPVATYDPPGLVFFDVDGVRLLLDRGAPSALLYLWVDDIHVTVERLRARGVEVRGEPHVIFGHDDDTLGPAGTDEWMAFVVDTEGNLVGLVEQRLAVLTSMRMPGPVHHERLFGRSVDRGRVRSCRWWKVHERVRP